MNLDQASCTVRTNEPGIYPSVDYSLSFNQMTFETCWDSKKALTDFFSSFNIPKPDFVSLADANPSPLSPDLINTFESVDQDAFLQSRDNYAETQSDFDLEMEDLEDELEWHMDFESTLSKEDVLVDHVKVFACATDFSINKTYLNELIELKPQPIRLDSF
jgi:hypothetical protein